MNRALQIYLILMVIFECTRALASDPNKVCVQNSGRLREVMMDQSQMARNALSTYAFFAKEPFSTVASRVRKIGAAAYLETSIASLDPSKLCEQGDGARCYTKPELIDLLRPTVKVLSTFPDVYDRTLIFEKLQAIDYRPDLERTTCHLSYFFDLDFMRQWYADLGISPANSEGLNIVIQTTKSLRASGKSFERKFTVQPDGRAGTNLSLLPN